MGRRFQKLSGFFVWIILGVLLAGGVGALIWYKTRPVGDLTIQLVDVTTEKAVDRKDIKPEKLKIDDKSPKITQKDGNIYLEYSRVSINKPIRLEFENFAQWGAKEENTKKGRDNRIAKLYPKPVDLLIHNRTKAQIEVTKIDYSEENSFKGLTDQFILPGDNLSLKSAFGYGVNTVTLRQAGFKPVRKPHGDRSPVWDTNATVEITDADFAGQEEKASLSLIFSEISFDTNKYSNLDAFLKSEVTNKITLSHQVGATNWSTLNNPIQYTVNPAVTNEIKFTNVHIGPMGFVQAKINHSKYSAINIDYEGLKDGDNVTKSSFLFIPNKATLTIEPDFKWTTNDYTGLKITFPPGVTRKTTSFVYELTPFKEHTFEFTGAGLKTNEFIVGPYPSGNYTTNIVVELKDDLNASWAELKAQVEENIRKIPSIETKFENILELAKSDIVSANNDLRNLYETNKILITGNDLKAIKKTFVTLVKDNMTYKRYFKEFDKNWQMAVDVPFDKIDKILTQPPGAKLEALQKGIKDLEALRTKTVKTFEMAKEKFKKVAKDKNDEFRDAKASDIEFIGNYTANGLTRFEDYFPDFQKPEYANDPLKFLYGLTNNASQKYFDTAIHVALKHEYTNHFKNINLLEGTSKPKGQDKFPGSDLKKLFKEAAQDKKALEKFLEEEYRPEYKAQYEESIKEVTDHWKGEIGRKKAQFDKHAPDLLQEFTKRIGAIEKAVKVEPSFILDGIAAEPRPGTYVDAIALEHDYNKTVEMLSAALEEKIDVAIKDGNMPVAWGLNDDFEAAFPRAIRPWKAKLKCIIQLVPHGGDIQIKIPKEAVGAMLLVGIDNLNQKPFEQLISPDKYPMVLKYMIDGLPVEYAGPVLTANRPTIKISLIQDNNLKPPRPQIIMGDKKTSPFRRMNLKNVDVKLAVKTKEGQLYMQLEFNQGLNYYFDLSVDDFLKIKDQKGKPLGGGYITKTKPKLRGGQVVFTLEIINGNHLPKERFYSGRCTVESALPPKEQLAKP